MTKGIYVLLISVRKDTQIAVGALGERFFQRGTYAYVGSGQSGIEQRVRRHLREQKKKFWHIDYLLGSRRTMVSKVFWRVAEKLEECRIAEEIGSRGVAVKGFGSSDCRCEGHLFRLADYEFLRRSMRELNTQPRRRKTRAVSGVRV